MWLTNLQTQIVVTGTRTVTIDSITPGISKMKLVFEALNATVSMTVGGLQVEICAEYEDMSWNMRLVLVAYLLCGCSS